MPDHTEKQDLPLDDVIYDREGIAIGTTKTVTSNVTDTETTAMTMYAQAPLTKFDDPKYAFKETVDHPKHYNSHPSGIECIDVIEHMPFNLGSAVKYIWRLGFKGAAIEQIEKAIWYLEREKQLIIKREKLVRNHNTGKYE